MLCKKKNCYKMVNSWDCWSQGNLRSDPVSNICQYVVCDCGKMYKVFPSFGVLKI